MMSAAEVRRVALALPEAVEQETWGHPTFRVRGKIFATLAPDGSTAGVKATLLEQAALVGSEPETYAVAEYTGRYGWVTARLDRADADELRALIREAWRQTAPRRLAAQLAE